MNKTKVLSFILLIVFSLNSFVYAITYRPGSTGKDVETIQKQLKDEGYLKSEATGYFGSQTEAAVKEFQKDQDLQVDGIVGDNTYKQLFENTKEAAAKETTNSNSSTKHIMSNKDIQTALKKLEYYTGNIDGILGSNTENAIKKFQKANKLTADGIVGPATAKVLTASVNSTSQTKTVSRGASSTMSIKDIQATLKKLGYYTGSVDGVSGSKTVSAIKKFQEANKLTAEGIVGAATIKKLETAAAKPAAAAPKSNSGVELLDWWSSASKIFTRGSIAKVTDVKTGKTFNIKRTYGTNHADVEALTSKDSEIIKGIWGGWSWTRRPIIVEVNGRKIAASMAAMPHAGIDSEPADTYVSKRSGGYSEGTNLDKVKNNGMDGHMDVHFLNSKTHSTNKVDPAHQAAVKQAAQY